MGGGFGGVSLRETVGNAKAKREQLCYTHHGKHRAEARWPDLTGAGAPKPATEQQASRQALGANAAGWKQSGVQYGERKVTLRCVELRVACCVAFVALRGVAWHVALRGCGALVVGAASLPRGARSSRSMLEAEWRAQV